MCLDFTRNIFSEHFRHYLKQVETWLSIVCALISLATAIGSEFTECHKEEIENRQCAHWILHCLSIAILLSWMQIMLLIGRFPMWGYYALMFSTVLKNVLKVCCNNLIIIIIIPDALLHLYTLFLRISYYFCNNYEKKGFLLFLRLF